MVNNIDIEKVVDEVLSNRKNSNNIIKIYNSLESHKDEDHKIACMKGLETIFTSHIKENEFNVDEELKLTNSKEWEIEAKYVQWLKEIYEKTLQSFYDLLDSDNNNIVEQALKSLMCIISHEGRYKYISNKLNKGKISLSFKDRLHKILEIILSTKTRKAHLIDCYKKYVNYKDIFLFSWKALSKIVPNSTDSSYIYTHNLLDLIETIPITKFGEKIVDNTQSQNELLCMEDGKKFIVKRSEIQQMVKKVWHSLINRPTTPSVHRKLMVVLLEKFLPNLDNPIYLTDFLIGSSHLEGANAILALQGILTLVQKCNMEYPNIYQKLYSMFEPNIFHTKYKSRLFYLADIFLSSSHLPENLVAAFAKRIARLSLSAQVPDIIISIRFIENLILRHPDLKKMIQHPDGGQVPEDPFSPDECDPMKSRAIESCLWEVCLLKNHVQPSVAAAANFIDGNLPTIEYDLGEVLDLTNEQLFEAESKKKLQESLTAMRPHKIAKLTDDRVYKCWALT